MEYTRLGNAGLKVGRLGLGCMSYGDPTTPNAHPWVQAFDSPYDEPVINAVQKLAESRSAPTQA